jgi:hypothetical protein
MAIMPFVMGLLVVVAGAPDKALSDPALLEQAEAAFRAGVAHREQPDAARSQFRQAASGYEELRRRGAANVDLYRNQGNAYLLAGDLPQAILAYRRGLPRNPADSFLRADLAYARSQVADSGSGGLGRPAVDNRPPWLPYLSLRPRLFFFLCSYSVGWLGIVRWWMVRRTAPLTLGMIAFGLAALVATSIGMEVWSKHQEVLHPLVVVAADDLPLRKGDGILYPSHYQAALHRGVEARLRFERGDWLQIELAGGQVGWIPRSAALVDTA